MLKKIISPLKNQRGTGLLILLVMLCALAVTFTIIIVEVNLIYINQSIANTRADAIADSVAVYALRYDNSFSQGDVLRMTALLAAHNNTDEDRPILVRAEVKNNRIVITTEVEGRFLTSRNTFISYGTAIVESVEPGRDIVFVP